MEKIKASKPEKKEAGSKDLKRGKEKLSKIKIDESFILERNKQLIKEGYSPEEAQNVSRKEAMVKTDNERIALYKENPDLKDAEEMIQKILIKRDNNQREINEILKIGIEEKDIKSNRQVLREAEEKLRNLAVDEALIKKEKEKLLQEGYPFDFSEKLSNINGEIILLENKIQIIIDNPKIENGLKTKKNLEDKLAKLEAERNTLLTSKPEKIKTEIKDKNDDLNIEKEGHVQDKHEKEKIGEAVENSTGEKVVKTKEEKISKKINWSKFNPISWFSKNKEKENWIEEELLGSNKNIKKEILLSHTGALPAFYEEKRKDDDIAKILDKKLEKEKRRIFLSHTGALPAFREDKIEDEENKEGKNNNEDLGLKLEEILVNKEKAILDKLNESKFRSTALKTIGAVENFGKNETGPRGLAKRLTKMGINLALIGLISSVAVDQLAEAGYGSATALSGGVFSKLAVKMGIGLGIGASMEVGGNKIPSKVRKFIPYVLGAGGVTAAVVLSGGLAGVAAGASFGLGLASQKWVKGRFTDEKIETKRANKIKEFYQKIEKEGFDINKSKKYEDEFEKIIKKYENQKIWGKLVDGATKLTVGTLVSGFALEASGIARDLTQGESLLEALTGDKAEAVTEEKAEVVTEEKAEVVTEEKAEINTEEKVEINTEEKAEVVKVMSETKNPEIKIISVEANDGQGAISTLRELQESLREEYQNVEKLPANVDHIINTDAHELAKEYGLYHPGEDAESAKVFVGDKMIFNKETGEVVFTHVRGGEDILQKGIEYKGGMFDSANKETEITPEDGKEESSDFLKNNPQVPPTDNPFADSAPIQTGEDAGPSFLDAHPQVPPGVAVNGEDVTGNLKPDIPKEELSNNEVSKTINDLNNEEAQGGGGQEAEKEPEPQSDSRDLSPREIRQVDRVFERNLDELFPKKQDMAFWNGIKGLNADKLYNMDVNQLNPKVHSLYDYIHKINEITGIEPKGETIIRAAETNLEFIERGLKEAVLIGKLDEVKL